MKKKSNLTLILSVLILVLMPVILMAQEAAPTVEQLLNMVIDIIKNYSTMSPILIASASLTFIIAILKTPWLQDSWFGAQGTLVKRAILVVLGQALALVTLYASGMPLANVFWTGLIISGGAIMIFECILSFLPEGTTKNVVEFIKGLLGQLKK